MVVAFMVVMVMVGMVVVIAVVVMAIVIGVIVMVLVITMISVVSVIVMITMNVHLAVKVLGFTPNDGRSDRRLDCETASVP